ncbi:hypothetical protein LQW54_000467 [Pestalotiopsis sp. IQ-011]
MDKLPAEAKDMICGFLSYKDAATFRLVCKNFALIGARRSHKKLIVNITPGRMDRLHNIAGTYVLRNNVEHVAIDSNLLQYYGSATTDLDAHIEYHVRSRGLDARMITKQQLQEAFDKITIYNEGIEILWDGNNIVLTLQTIVGIFPRLKKLEIAHRLRDRDEEDTFKLRDYKQAIMRVNGLTMPETLYRLTRQNELNDALSQVRLRASLQSLTTTLFRIPRRPFHDLRNLRTLELTSLTYPIIHKPWQSMRFGADLPQGTLANLRIEGVNINRSNFLQFLDANQKSLKCVHIRACKIDWTFWDCLYACLALTPRPEAFTMGADYVPSSWATGACIHRHFESVEESGHSASHRRINDMVASYLKARDDGTLGKIGPETTKTILARMGIEYPGRHCPCEVLRLAPSRL